MKRKILVTIMLIGVVMLNSSIAQELEHLRPVQVTEISLVRHDSTQFQNAFQRHLCSYIDTNITFYECRNNTATVGYLLKVRDSHDRFNAYIRDKNGTPILVGLTEVQRAENLLAKELDLLADKAQYIQRALTAPHFYQYIRQYVFYLTTKGDTCVLINFTIPDNGTCLDRMFHAQCDGDDTYWVATLNLSKGQIQEYYINGPTIFVVKGRNKEPHGLGNQCVFLNGRWRHEKTIPYSKLPQKIKNLVTNPQDTTLIYEQSLYKGHYYYAIFTDSIQRGYHANGKWMFTGAKELYWGNLPVESLQSVQHIKQMLTYIHEDMSRRGQDFAINGKIISLEVVKRHYVIHIKFKPEDIYCASWVAYTFDLNGNFVGIDLGWY